MPETLEYRVGKAEQKIIENEMKNTAAHEKFYTHNQEHLKFEASLHERCDTRHKDLDQLMKDNVDFKVFMAQTNTNYANLNGTMQTVAADLKMLKEKPTKRWENVIDRAITVIVTALITYIISGSISL